jgi:hypothetical protein
MPKGRGKEKAPTAYEREEQENPKIEGALTCDPPHPASVEWGFEQPHPASIKSTFASEACNAVYPVPSPLGLSVMSEDAMLGYDKVCQHARSCVCINKT